MRQADGRDSHKGLTAHCVLPCSHQRWFPTQRSRLGDFRLLRTEPGAGRFWEQLSVEDAPVNPDRQLRERWIVGVDRDRSVEAARAKGFGAKADVDSKGAAQPRRRRDANGERFHIRANASKPKLSFALL